MATSLDDVLSEKKEEKEPAPKEEPKEPAAESRAEPDKGVAADGQAKSESRRREHQKKEWEAQGRDPATGQFVPKEMKAEAPTKKEEPKKEDAPKAEAKPEAPKPPPQEMNEKERAAFAAAADERRKRQALEQELAQLRAQQPQKPAEPAKTFWDNPDEALAKERQERQGEYIQMKLGMSEMMARQRYPDFEEKLNTFKAVAGNNPALVQAWLAAPDPGEYLYKFARNHQELQQLGGLDQMRKKIEADTAAKVRAEVEAEYKRKEEEAAKLRAAIPPSISDVRGASTNKSAPVWGGPRPLDAVLGKG